MSPIGLARAWLEYCRPTWQWRWTWKGSVWIAASRYYRPLLLLALLLSGCAQEDSGVVWSYTSGSGSTEACETWPGEERLPCTSERQRQYRLKVAMEKAYREWNARPWIVWPTHPLWCCCWEGDPCFTDRSQLPPHVLDWLEEQKAK